MPLYKQDSCGTFRLGNGYGTLCGNHLYVRKGHEDEFKLLIGSIPSSNTYRRKFNGEIITRFLKNGKPVKSSNGKYFLVLKRKTDGKDYLSAIQVIEYSPKFLNPV